MPNTRELEQALAAAAKTFDLMFKDASPPKEGFVKANGGNPLRRIALVLAGLLIFVAACDSSPVATETATLPPTKASPTAVQTAAILPPTSQANPTAASRLLTYTAGRVVNVVDGDTIVVAIGAQTYRVRYIGVDTPETVDPNRPVQPYGKEASARNTQLVMGKTVYLERDVSETDRFGRLLRYVWLDEKTMVNAVLVAEGYAQVATFPPDVKYVALYQDLQREAREKALGLWGGSAIVVTPTTRTTAIVTPQATVAPTLPSSATAPANTPTRTATPPPSPTPDRGSCDPSYPTVCIPRFPPDLNCNQIPYRNFQAIPPDPHRFDADRDGIGCES